MRRLIFGFFASFLLAGIGLGTGHALAAEPAGRAAANAAYIELCDTIEADADEDGRLDYYINTLAEQMTTATPSLMEAEASYPGISMAMAEAIRPVIKSHSQRVRKAYRPRMVAALKEGLTEPEARKLTALMRSPIGRSLIAGPHTDAAVKAELDADAILALAQLSREERAELERSTMEKKFEAVAAKLAGLRASMELEPLTAEEEAQMNTALQAAIAAYKAKFAKDDDGS